MPSTQRKLIILGAGIFQLYAIRKAQAMDIQVIAISNLRTDPGLTVADKYFPISTLEKEAVLQIALLERISGIITVASEVAAPTVAWVAEKLYLPGYSYETALTIANKLQLREFFKKKKLSKIGFGDASTAKAAKDTLARLTLPLMLKPLLSSGSRGIRLISNAEDLDKYLPESIANSFVFKGALLEEFVPGRAVGGSLLISKGKIVASAFSEKFLNDRFVTTGHLMPPLLAPEQLKKIDEIARKVASSLNLQDGTLDLDMVLNENGPEVIELGGRLGGNAVAELASRHTGVDFIEAAIRIAVGETLKPFTSINKPVAVHIIGSNKSGILRKIHRFEELFPDNKENLMAQNEFIGPGTEVHAFTQGNFQLGNIILTAPTAEALMALMQQVQSTIWTEVE